MIKKIELTNIPEDQTFHEKLEVIRNKINEIIDNVNPKN